MSKRTRNRFFSGLLGLCCLTAPINSSRAQESSVPPRSKQVLFSLPFGRRWEQIGASWPKKNAKESEWTEPSGPVGIEVKSNRVYIGDRLNGCVKWFSMQGKFLGKTTPLKENTVDFVAAKDGTICLLTQSSLDGEPLLYKFDSQGKLLWKVRQWDVFSPGWGLQMANVSVLSQGYIGVFLRSPRVIEDKMAVFDDKGHWIYTVSARRATEEGLFFQFPQLEGQKWTERVQVFEIKAGASALQPATQTKLKLDQSKAAIQRSRGDGFYIAAPKIKAQDTKQIGNTLIRPMASTIPLLKLSQGYTDGNVESHGTIYSTATLWRTHPTPTDIMLGTKSADTLLLVYNSKGHGASYLRFYDCPLFGFSKPISAPSINDVYVLSMTTKGFDVVRYQLKQPQKRQ